jgi:hypothetical protein
MGISLVRLPGLVTEILHFDRFPSNFLASSSRVHSDLRSLFERIEQRSYPETIPALAYFWLRTLYISGYGRGEWNLLDDLLQDVLGSGWVRPDHFEVLSDIRARIRDDGLLSGDAPAPSAPALDERAAPGADVLVPYFVRVLNDWLPKEIAWLLMHETWEDAAPGIPALAVASALERLLVRQRLSAGSLELVLDPAFFSPRFVYAAHYEILRDVALFLLGRTAPPAVIAGPAALLCTAPGARLLEDYTGAVANAGISVVSGPEQLEVPITPAQWKALFAKDEFRVASIVVTMDGRWWRAHTLRGGDQNAILYRPGGRLRIDFSGEHARLRVPWLDRRDSWSGNDHLPSVELFGREWHTIRWEQDADHTWLELAFSQTLPVAKLSPNAGTQLRRCRPAFVDMTWTALETALASADKDGAAVEQLRRDETIPLGRSLLALIETASVSRGRTLETIEIRLNAVVYHVSALEPAYGKVPWRILPKRVRGVLLGNDLYPVLRDRLRSAFEDVPERRRGPGILGWLPHSPKRAA